MDKKAYIQANKDWLAKKSKEEGRPAAKFFLFSRRSSFLPAAGGRLSLTRLLSGIHILSAGYRLSFRLPEQFRHMTDSMVSSSELMIGILRIKMDIFPMIST